MSNLNIGFVKLHRSGLGRLGVIVNVVFMALIFTCLGLFIYKMYSLYVSLTNTPTGTPLQVERVYSYFYYLLPVYVIGFLQPFVLLYIASRNSKRLLANPDDIDEIATALKQLQLQWLFRKNGSGCVPWNRVELGLPRTIADSSLEEQLNEIELPVSLIEPEAIKSSKPGSKYACIASFIFLFGLVISLFFLPAFSTQGTIWVFMPVALFGAVFNFLAIPAVQRSRKLPPLLRNIARLEPIGKSMVVGPGWVKFKKRIWRADRDLLMIRRKGVRKSSEVIDCMLAGPEGRRRMRFSGVGDDDFQLLFGGWNIEEVRMELVESDLG